MRIEITIHPGEAEELAELLRRLSQHIENGHCLSAILDRSGKPVGTIEMKPREQNSNANVKQAFPAGRWT